ncbi:hypothetical protein QOT17_000781 [Balamuthia mandrillaris]
MAFISELHDYDADGSTSTPHSSHTFTIFSLPMTRRSSAVVREYEHTLVQGPALRSKGPAIESPRALLPGRKG